MPAELLAEGRIRLPSLIFAAGVPAARPRTRFTLTDAAEVDPRLRGTILEDVLAAPLGQPGDHHAVLAAAGGEPVWTLACGTAPVHTVRVALPELADDEVLYRLLSKSPLSAVALIQFLRGLVNGASAGASPRLRATFLFDDPNLRRAGYGHINYALLADHAEAHGYHASMAMIPLDAGRPHAPTAELFRRRPERLSLVVHGNDHTKNELLAVRDHGAARAIAGQAMRRIARFERRAGLSVDRVMTPPHGLCSMSMARALGAVGFDALCAIHSLPWTETPPAGPLLAGWRGGEFVAGCAVVPRIPIESTQADIALRAFIGHPLIVYGHHGDVADGLERLAEMARTINRLGEVRWSSVGEIVNSNMQVRLEGEHLIVRPLARRIRLAIDAGVREITFERPDDLLDAAGPLAGVSVTPVGGGAPREHGTSLLRFGERLLLGDSDTPALEVRLHGVGDVDPECVPEPAWRPWPRARRVVAELRDRSSPRASDRARDPESCRAGR